MNIKKTLLVLFISLINITFFQAQSVSGKILSTENLAIPYATIQIGEKHGTISNQEGDFTISTKGFAENEIVKISYLGFETKEIPLNKFISKDYILKERFDVLSEVYLTNKKLNVEEILQKVKDSISSNYNLDFKSQIFYRNTIVSTPKKMEFEILKASELSKSTIKTINSQFEDLQNFAVNKTSTYYKDILLNYAKLNDSIKINVTKATKLINQAKDKSTDKLQTDFIKIITKQLDSSSTYKLKSGLFKIEDSIKVDNVFKTKETPKTKEIASDLKVLLNKNAINENSYFSFLFNTSKNDYTLDGISYFNGNPVYKITFTPKRKSEKFEGVFYVNTKDFAVIKIDYNLAENRFGKRLNLKMLVGIKFIENKINGSVLFKKGDDNLYSPQFINIEKQQYAYLSRPLKFIKNVMSEDDEKTTFKFKFKVEATSSSKEELYFIENTTTNNTNFKEFLNEDEYQIESIEAYNPEIWKNYKIISPVESIKNYHLED